MRTGLIFAPNSPAGSLSKTAEPSQPKFCSVSKRRALYFASNKSRSEPTG